MLRPCDQGTHTYLSKKTLPSLITMSPSSAHLPAGWVLCETQATPCPDPVGTSTPDPAWVPPAPPIHPSGIWVHVHTHATQDTGTTPGTWHIAQPTCKMPWNLPATQAPAGSAPPDLPWSGGPHISTVSLYIVRLMRAPSPKLPFQGTYTHLYTKKIYIPLYIHGYTMSLQLNRSSVSYDIPWS